VHCPGGAGNALVRGPVVDAPLAGNKQLAHVAAIRTKAGAALAAFHQPAEQIVVTGWR
jgi:hypothetical protein